MGLAAIRLIYLWLVVSEEEHMPPPQTLPCNLLGHINL